MALETGFFEHKNERVEKNNFIFGSTGGCVGQKKKKFPDIPLSVTTLSEYVTPWLEERTAYMRIVHGASLSLAIQLKA